MGMSKNGATCPWVPDHLSLGPRVHSDSFC